MESENGWFEEKFPFPKDIFRFHVSFPVCIRPSIKWWKNFHNIQACAFDTSGGIAGTCMAAGCPAHETCWKLRVVNMQPLTLWDPPPLRTRAGRRELDLFLQSSGWLCSIIIEANTRDGKQDPQWKSDQWSSSQSASHRQHCRTRCLAVWKIKRLVADHRNIIPLLFPLRFVA